MVAVHWLADESEISVNGSLKIENIAVCIVEVGKWSGGWLHRKEVLERL